MAIKIEVKGGFLKVTNEDGSTDRFIRVITTYSFNSDNSKILIREPQGTNQVTHSYNVSDIVDKNGNPFEGGLEGLEDFLDTSLGVVASGSDNSASTVINNAGGNAIVEFYHYSFQTNFDNDNFFNDGNIKVSWDTNGKDIELYMITPPEGTGDLVSLATKGVTSVVSKYVTQVGYKYDVYPPGVNATEGLIIWVTAEYDLAYPSYKIYFHNAGTSYNSNVEVKKITPKIQS